MRERGLRIMRAWVTLDGALGRKRDLLERMRRRRAEREASASRRAIERALARNWNRIMDRLWRPGSTLVRERGKRFRGEGGE
jgi:hypothetical protein